ncbi:hypothetical protein LSH36_302g02037 [Paralvinella palmiformis]|uniref:protein-serine/threonine phosphatase n=1 Tax=Paralvinella palmiformis TaxID=53620 RepID=A0AAD9JHM4_9ANNE|nr:hypothetical protein LSH36_302g02037 [Paralvinella palmiformis]
MTYTCLSTLLWDCVVSFYSRLRYGRLYVTVFDVKLERRLLIKCRPGSVIADVVRRKTMVLDLDETLIHSHHDGVLRQTVKPGTPPDFVLKVVIDRHPVRFFVHKRPHVDFFLDIVSQWYDLVVFTASMEIYGAAVADKLDSSKGILKRRYYRQHCNLDFGSYTKDLSAISSDLSSIFILDNSPGAYKAYPDNAIPIKSWFSDPTDTALLNLLPMLDALRFVSDVRSVLSRNLHLHRLWQ